MALSADFAQAVRRHVDGLASDADLALLEANTRLWVRALYRLLDDVAESIDGVRATVRGHQRALIVADLEDDYRAIDAVLAKLVGPPRAPRENGSSKDARSAGIVELQLSWVPGRVIAWAAGPGRTAEGAPEVLKRLRDAGAGTVEWSEHRPVTLGGGARAEAVSAPIESCLGWLVALGEAAEEDGIGASVSWLGLVAALAVRLAAQGRMVPQLKKVRRRYHPDDEADGAASAAAEGADSAAYAVRWAPALVESDIVAALADSLPGAAAAFENQRDAPAFTQAALADIFDAIATEAAERLEAPAAPPAPRTRTDVAETALARLDGTPFDVPSRHASDLARRLDQWARPATEPYDPRLRLIVQLDSPDDIGAWHLSVLSKSSAGELQPVERALVIASRARRQAVKHQMTRLERLFPELVRLGGRRRGEVILDTDEAWQLMTETGHVLQAVGYEVRVPALSRRRPTPSLRLTSVEAQETMVGARQLADVRWSVAFDDVELTAAEIRALASHARPLVKSRGRWVELDRADLNEAAAALAERADVTRMTGADMLRHALGLEGSPLSGGTMVAGESWAAELIRSARSLPTELPTRPDGFSGMLRTYQADALVWLGFLEQTGLGGCLALDMGLGKTPTTLAHIYLTRGNGPSLVAAPPAVVGNWASEARRFVPGLRVVVHHGPSRTPPGAGAGHGGAGRPGGLHLRHRHARHGRAGEGRVVHRGARRGPGHQEPGQRDRPAAAPAQCPLPGHTYRHPYRERLGRPVGHHGLLQPGPAGSPQPLHRRDVEGVQEARDGPRGRRGAPTDQRRPTPRRHLRPPRPPARVLWPRSTASWCSDGPRPSPPSPRSCPTASTSSTTAR